MIIQFPLMIDKSERRKKRKDGTEVTITNYKARAIFAPDFEAAGTTLASLYTELRTSIKRFFRDRKSYPDHGYIEQFAYSPELKPGRVNGACHLRRSTLNYDLFTLEFPAFGNAATLIPHLGKDFLIYNPPKENKKQSVQAALHKYFYQMEKEDPDSLPQSELRLGKNAFIDYLEVDVPEASSLRSPKAANNDFSLINRSSVGDGYVELHKVGASLVDRFPDDFSRAYCREDLVERLMQLLEKGAKKPLMLLGKAKSGKTSILEEAVFRILSDRPKRLKHAYRKGFWQIHANRLIAGMSYVGEWEQRLMGILEEARNKDHVLIFENLAALFQLGKSASSKLSMADVIKNFLQKSSIRFVGEITEEKLSLLQEIDRSFCDLFEIIRIPELDSDSSLKVIINKQRELETKFGVRFDASIVPLANDLQRRFNRHESRPGSVVAFLSNLASRNSYESIDRSSVIKSFSEQSGFFASFIDHTLTLSQEEIAAGLGKEWIGQEAALQTLAATISTARSGIQDPHKPFGCFLFLGPTGVGKTECAKGLARYLYGSEERLLRYDMNEYVSEHSVSQLYGTYEQPDGYLTSAIRLQPYSIVLFDEIEKAHPDVYDVLLQVLGEGRLSDALGRTVDFTNSIIILTSNLGVRESQRSFGFGAPTADPNAFLTAAQKFFRPEFYNRIDSIIPFRSLTRDEISDIAERLIDSLFKRSGFLQRHACIEISPQAKEWLIDRGYDPIYGARALKRELEQSVSKPVSRMLSKTQPQQPIVLEIDESGDRLLTKVTPLENASESRGWRPSIKKDNTLKAIEALQEFTSDIERDLPDDLIASSASSPSIFDHDDPYYDDHPVGASEELRHLKTKLTELQFELEEDRLRRLSHGLRRQTANIHYDKWGNKPLNIRDLFAVDDFNLFLDQLFENQSLYSTQPNEASNERSLQSALQKAVLLGLQCDASAPIETALIIESRDFPKHIHPRPLQSGIEYLNQNSEDTYIASICRGRNLRALLKHAEGTCLNIDATSGSITPLQLKTRFLDPEQPPQEQAAALLQETRPCGPFLPVTLIQRRLQNGRIQFLDLRTGKTQLNASRFWEDHIEIPQPLVEKLKNAGL